MKNATVLLLGGGKIGQMIASLLSHCGTYQVTVADRDLKALSAFKSMPVNCICTDISDAVGLRKAAQGFRYILSACPFSLTPVIAAAAKDVGAHYFDLTEDVASTRAVKALACDATTAFMPQCGLAPGFISIVAQHLAQQFDDLTDLHMRVGALPLYPSNALKYNLTWSTDGLINEYCNPCEAIVEGRMREVMPLEGHEYFALDGVEYEAFNTSGGLGTLCETLAGKVQDLNYRTVRYPGHLDIVRLLVNELKLGQRRDLLKEILEGAIPLTLQDVVLVFVTAAGRQNGRFIQQSYARKIYSDTIHGQLWSAIQITTAAGICAALDLLHQGKLPQQGFICQEQIPLDAFLENRFGRYFASGEALKLAA